MIANDIHDTRGLLATHLVILSHGQVTRPTPELALPSPNYHTTPTGERLSSRQIYRASLPYTAGLECYWARTHDMPTTIRYLDHWATAAPFQDRRYHPSLERAWYSSGHGQEFVRGISSVELWTKLSCATEVPSCRGVDAVEA
ncbi:hypothetical protein TNCV_4522891 [Trichonephila clavipes]|nr:hypothetical protein TNCV_4522891 [Trichonephila clavipes]